LQTENEEIRRLAAASWHSNPATDQFLYLDLPIRGDSLDQFRANCEPGGNIVLANQAARGMAAAAFEKNVLFIDFELNVIIPLILNNALCAELRKLLNANKTFVEEILSQSIGFLVDRIYQSFFTQGVQIEDMHKLRTEQRLREFGVCNSPETP